MSNTGSHGGRAKPRVGRSVGRFRPRGTNIKETLRFLGANEAPTAQWQPAIQPSVDPVSL